MVRLRRMFLALANRVRSPTATEAVTASLPTMAGGYSAKFNEISSLKMQQIVVAIHVRETRGEATTLRQLHAVADMTQPEALLALGHLERAGSVCIEDNLNDAFASELILTEPTRRWIEQNRIGEHT